MFMTAEKKHFHLIFITDDNWKHLKRLSPNTDDALTELFSSHHHNPQTIQDELAAAMQALSKAYQTLAPQKQGTVREVAEVYFDEVDRRRKSASLREYMEHAKNHIFPAIGDKNIADVTRQEILALQEDCASKVSTGYANEIIKTLKRIFEVAKREEFIQKDVCAAVGLLPEKPCTARKTKHRALEREKELNPFLKELVKEHLYFFLCFMLESGLRQGEASSLRPSDIHDGYIWVNRTMTVDKNHKVVEGDMPKSDAGRRKIPINDKLKYILDQIGMPEDNSYIFKSVRGKPVSNSAANKAIGRTLKRLDENGIHIEHFTTHALRATFATDYVRAHADMGGDTKTLQELLGHANRAITEDLYVHVLDDSKIDGMRRMDQYTG